MTGNEIPNGAGDPTEAIRQITKTVYEMLGVLRSQRDTLARRAINLPDEPLYNLERFAIDLDRLSLHLSNNLKELQQFRELARNAELINSTQNPTQVLNDVIDTVIALTDAERGYIVLKNPDTGELEFRVARKMQQHDISSDEFIVSRTIVERVASSGEPIVTINAQEDQRFAASASVADYQLRSILCVPLKRKGEVTGVIYCDNRFRQNLFTDREQRVVYAFANQAAIAIENARLFEQVRASLTEITAIKDFMDNVFASIASGVVTTDRDDLIMAINEAARRILNIHIENIVSQSLWSVLPPLYEGFSRLVAEVRDQEVQQSVEVEPLIDQRGQVNLSLKLSPFKDAAAMTQGVAIVVDDLTELRQRQEQLSVVRRYLTPAMVDNIKTIDEFELGGMEREISVVFCDVRGFTTFSEQLPPDELMQVINRYLSVSTEAINTYDGIVDKYMGDAVVGLFNTQLNPIQNHAMHAFQTALSIVEGVQALHKVLPPEQCLFYGIGVHTGPAILGNVGSPRRKEFTAIGNTLQFAKLLQENALEGEIILSQAIYEILGSQIHADALAPRKVKDQADFTVMYRVAGLSLSG